MRRCIVCDVKVSRYNPPMSGRDFCYQHRPDTGLCVVCHAPLLEEDFPRRRTDRMRCSKDCRVKQPAIAV